MLAQMTTGDVAAVVVAALSGVLVVVLLLVLSSVTKTLKNVRDAVDELRLKTLPVINKLETTVEQANAELVRADALLETAESVGTTVDAASRLAYLAFSNPVIKILAIGSGTARAARRLRRTDGS